MFKVIAGFSLLVSVSTLLAEPPQEPSVLIKCTGRLRDGIVAIGGETTGTILTSEHVTWELRLATESQRAFAQQNNKETVTVVGTVQRVEGIERPTRWIVDVAQIELAKPADAKSDPKMSVAGRIELVGDKCGEGHAIAVKAGEQTWPLKFAADSNLKSVAETSVGLMVKLAGVLESTENTNPCAPGTIRVTAIDAS